MNRRAFLRLTAALGAGSFVGASATGRSADAQVASWSPYGKLMAADANGIRLPSGFSSRVIAVSGQTVGQTGYIWPGNPDGAACFRRHSSGWIYVANSEINSGGGGVSAVKFDPSGGIVAAYRILGGTSFNCSGGRTPWDTWLSGEETSSGQIHECDPWGVAAAVVRPALGTFAHEAAAVDPATGAVYLSEDRPDGRLYKFVPAVLGDLSAGVLYAANLTNGLVSWVPTSSAQPERTPATTAFAGGEGLWISDGRLFFTTKHDIRVWELVLATGRMRVMYDGVARAGASLDAVDNVVVHEPSGDLFVCEDGGNMELGILSTIDDSGPAPFLRVLGQSGSEITGIAFTPEHDRLYFSSQRGPDGNGITYEVSGPFRQASIYRATNQESPAQAMSPARRLG